MAFSGIVILVASLGEFLLLANRILNPGLTLEGTVTIKGWNVGLWSFGLHELDCIYVVVFAEQQHGFPSD